LWNNDLDEKQDFSVYSEMERLGGLQGNRRKGRIKGVGGGIRGLMKRGKKKDF